MTTRWKVLHKRQGLSISWFFTLFWGQDSTRGMGDHDKNHFQTSHPSFEEHRSDKDFKKMTANEQMCL
jgi:hypothetical protein